MADPSASLSLLEACWRDLVLGVVQGLTEFLPISSTAHLKVVPELLGWGDPGVSVTAAIQPVSYTHPPSPRDKRQSRMPSSA